MDAYQRLRATVVGMIVRDTPERFWIELRDLARITYADAFAGVAADRNVVPAQKLDDLLQRRHFRMEKVLVDLAARHGLSHSMSVIVENGRCHAYVFKDATALTQCYVQAIGSMPQPAKFRTRLAEAMDLPRLDLGDEPEGAFVMPSVYGVVAHNPVGRRFDADEQRLGDIRVCVPARDFRAWAAELSITEVLAGYPKVSKKGAPGRSLRWKRLPGDEGTGTEGGR